MAINLTRDNVVDYVRNQLAFPIVDVELEDEHIDQAIENSLMLFNRFIGEIQMRCYYERLDSVVIDMEEGVRGVCDTKCSFPESNRIFAQLNVFELMYRMVYPNLPIGEWYFLRTAYELYMRVRGSEPEWLYDEFSRRLYVDCSGGPWDIYVALVKDLTMDTLQEGFRAYTKPFLDATVAHAKEILAKVRGKYAGIPAPGGNLMADADKLGAEAAAVIDETKLLLENEARFAAPIIMEGA